METDWAENRAKIAAGRDARLPRQASLDTRVFDRRARQVPHAPGAHAGRQGHRDLHQPPRHGGGLHAPRDPATGNAGDRAGSRAPSDPEPGGGVPAPPDGAPRRAGGARQGARRRRRRRRRPRARSARATTAPSSCRCTSRSTAPGGASASRSTASASRSRTATARRALYFVRYADPERTWREGPRRGLLHASLRRARAKVKAEQYRVQVSAGPGSASQVNGAQQGRRRRQLADRAAHPHAAARAAEVSCCASPRSRAAASGNCLVARALDLVGTTTCCIDCGLSLRDTERRLGAPRPRAGRHRRDARHPRARRPCRLRRRLRRRARRARLPHPRHARAR